MAWLVPAATHVPSYLYTLVTTTAILLVQVVWLYPRLELRGEYAIYTAIKSLPEDAFSSTQRRALDHVANTVETHAEPARAFHIVYVLAEVLQVLLLGRFAWLCLTAAA